MKISKAFKAKLANFAFQVAIGAINTREPIAGALRSFLEELEKTGNDQS
ncbi:MAG: hypothetical protein KME13_20370 [Myxacorys californica WJT36-NPBG1]|jgi:hypothetical protein|nr:hypothetical protein [Myxacorys californica WJT36-NPBG1]